MTSSPSSIIEFPQKGTFFHNSIFLFVDLQLEYLSSGRAYAFENIESCLENSLKLLQFAREQGLTIVHFRKLMEGTFFNQETKFSDWIENFRPYASEMVFERNQSSIFSNNRFSTFLDSIHMPELIVSGLTGEQSCLSIAVESSNKNYRMTFVRDASATRAFGEFNEKKSHEIISEIIKLYAMVTTTQELLHSLKETNMQKDVSYEL